MARQAGTPTLPEIGLDDNSALVDVALTPFDVYVSECVHWDG